MRIERAFLARLLTSKSNWPSTTLSRARICSAGTKRVYCELDLSIMIIIFQLLRNDARPLPNRDYKSGLHSIAV